MEKSQLFASTSSETKSSHLHASTSSMVEINVQNNSNNSHEQNKQIIPITSTLSSHPKLAPKIRRIRNKPRVHPSFSYFVKRKKRGYFQSQQAKGVTMSCTGASCTAFELLRKAVAVHALLFRHLTEIGLKLDVSYEINTIVIASLSFIKYGHVSILGRIEDSILSLLECVSRVIKVYLSIMRRVLHQMRLNIHNEEAEEVPAALGA